MCDLLENLCNEFAINNKKVKYESFHLGMKIVTQGEYPDQIGRLEDTITPTQELEESERVSFIMLKKFLTNHYNFTPFYFSNGFPTED